MRITTGKRSACRVGGQTYEVAQLSIPCDKMTQYVADTFFATPRFVSFLAMRMIVSHTIVDFKLRRPPGSALDLAKLAQCYVSGGGHSTAACIQLHPSNESLPDVLFSGVC